LAAIQALTQRVATLEGRPSPTPTATSAQPAEQRQPPEDHSLDDDEGPTPRIPDPERFDGDRAKLRQFLRAVSNVIEMQPRRFCSEKIKVLYAGTLLSGPPLDWFQTYQDRRPEERPAWFEDFELFKTTIERAYGDPDRAASAVRALFAIRQGNRTAAAYATEFQQITAQFSPAWCEPALCAHFHRGLSDSIKDQLAIQGRLNELLHNQSELIDEAIRIDNRIVARNQEKNTHQPRTTRKAKNMDANATVGEPTAQDARKKAPVPQEEHERRLELNLCFRCGSADHKARDCPLGQEGQAHNAGKA